MATFGVSCGYHDAAVSVIDDGEILFAGHAERYSRIKNDKYLNPALVKEALEYGDPDRVVFYESPFLKWTRRWYAGQKDNFAAKAHIREHFGRMSIKTVGHHESHAAAGYFTSGFTDAAIIVVDAIGEWDTISVWTASGSTMKKVWSTRYPNSLGLLYSAFTKRCGFKPNEEEYIMMGAAAFGDPNKLKNKIKADFISDSEPYEFILKQDVHKGIGTWQSKESVENIAAGIQSVLEDYLEELFFWVAATTGKRKLVYMGGVALNCVANAKLVTKNIFDDVWIMPNPGDAGSSLGAALAYTQEHAIWRTPFLGTNIHHAVDVDRAVHLLKQGPIGVASGRAEFGPRAFGNRSILADPRARRSKFLVNQIKQRQQFRPFAASVLADHAHETFVIPETVNSKYMQYTWRVRQPRSFPAICHVDSTSRIQMVGSDSPVLYDILTAWHKETGCPMLLNTSLNIKGMPLVNSWADALEFQLTYDLKFP